MTVLVHEESVALQHKRGEEGLVVQLAGVDIPRGTGFELPDFSYGVVPPFTFRIAWEREMSTLGGEEDTIFPGLEDLLFVFQPLPHPLTLLDLLLRTGDL